MLVCSAIVNPVESLELCRLKAPEPRLTVLIIWSGYMKIYISIGAMFLRPRNLLRKLTVILTCTAAITCTQFTFAQTLGQWEEPPGGYTWPFKAIHMSLMPDAQILTWEFGGDSAHLWKT